LIFSGARLDVGIPERDRRAPLKKQKKGGWGVAGYKQSTPTEFGNQPASRGSQITARGKRGDGNQAG